MPDDRNEPALERAKREEAAAAAFRARQERLRDAVLDDVPGRRLQWIGVLLAPAAFAAHLEIGYLLVPWGCVQRTTLWIHVAGVLSVLVAAAGVVAAWVTWQRVGRQRGEGFGVVPRTRFMGEVGLGVSALLTLILFWQWVAAFFIGPCQ